jgi:hypothetical protein
VSRLPLFHLADNFMIVAHQTWQVYHFLIH